MVSPLSRLFRVGRFIRLYHGAEEAWQNSRTASTRMAASLNLPVRLSVRIACFRAGTQTLAENRCTKSFHRRGLGSLTSPAVAVFR